MPMDLNKIEQLLEKYWNTETSLEEEQELRDYFRSSTFPDSMKEAALLFRFLDTEKNKSLQENFERDVTKQLSRRHGGKVISMSFTNIMRIAAGIAVVVVATYFIRQEVRKSYPKELQDTYTDPQMAFEETKKALMMISNSFGKAKREAGKIKMFNDAEKKIQSKQDTGKVSI
jgi:hypothetical protein